MKRFLKPKLIFPLVTVILLAAAIALRLSANPIFSHAASVPTTPPALPSFNHIVVVVEENHSYSQIIGSSSAPYIDSLATQGALFTNSYAITHPSEPNYLALFAGSTFGLSSDACPTQFSPPDLGSQLSAQHLSFAGYSEGMPAAGYTGCFSPSPRVDSYRRDHNPWADFSDTVGAQTNLPFTSFPTDFTTLPTVSFIVPSGQDDMHSGSVSTGDTWLKTHLDRYVQWAKANDSLLVLTWDEDNFTSVNHIPTIFVGAHVKVAYRSPTTINHYSVLRTLEDIYGLGCLRNACSAATITDVWM